MTAKILLGVIEPEAGSENWVVACVIFGAATDFANSFNWHGFNVFEL